MRALPDVLRVAERLDHVLLSAQQISSFSEKPMIEGFLTFSQKTKQLELSRKRPHAESHKSIFFVLSLHSRVSLRPPQSLPLVGVEEELDLSAVAPLDGGDARARREDLKRRDDLLRKVEHDREALAVDRPRRVEHERDVGGAVAS